MSWLLRLLIYAPVLLLICVVYAGQKHDNARDTLRHGVRLTVKNLIYTAVLVVVMFVLEFLFID